VDDFAAPLYLLAAYQPETRYGLTERVNSALRLIRTDSEMNIRALNALVPRDPPPLLDDATSSTDAQSPRLWCPHVFLLTDKATVGTQHDSVEQAVREAQQRQHGRSIGTSELRCKLEEVIAAVVNGVHRHERKWECASLPSNRPEPLSALPVTITGETGQWTFTNKVAVVDNTAWWLEPVVEVAKRTDHRVRPLHLRLLDIEQCSGSNDYELQFAVCGERRTAADEGDLTPPVNVAGEYLLQGCLHDAALRDSLDRDWEHPMPQRRRKSDGAKAQNSGLKSSRVPAVVVHPSPESLVVRSPDLAMVGDKQQFGERFLLYTETECIFVACSLLDEPPDMPAGTTSNCVIEFVVQAGAVHGEDVPPPATQWVDVPGATTCHPVTTTTEQGAHWRWRYVVGIDTSAAVDTVGGDPQQCVVRVAACARVNDRSSERKVVGIARVCRTAGSNQVPDRVERLLQQRRDERKASDGQWSAGRVPGVPVRGRDRTTLHGIRTSSWAVSLNERERQFLRQYVRGATKLKAMAGERMVQRFAELVAVSRCCRVVNATY